MPRSRSPISSSRKKSSADLITPERTSEQSAWARAIDRIVCGEQIARFVRVGSTPALLRSYGLGPGDLVMSAGKIARARRMHPEVALQIWRDLPELLAKPKAIFPSARRDGSIIVATIASDAEGYPVIAPIVWDDSQHLNIVLSLYGRKGTERLNAQQWLDAQIQSARAEKLPVYEDISPAGAEPKPNPASSEATSWSPGMIPADRPARPRKHILSLRKQINDDAAD
jgi:hypothetical protein